MIPLIMCFFFIFSNTWGNPEFLNYSIFNRMHRPMFSLTKQQTFNNTNIGKTLVTKVIFLLGRPQSSYLQNNYENDSKQQEIVKEAQSYGDILQEDFLDSYNNLTLKSIMLLKWVNNVCGTNVKYVLKVDDDTFVNVPNLIHILIGGTVPVYNTTLKFYDSKTLLTLHKDQPIMKTKDLLLGYLFCGAKPVADATSKWYTPYYLYKQDQYPPYLSGTAYLLSLSVVRKLYEQALETPYFHLEDVYITGICASKRKIKRIHSPLFYFSSPKTSNQNSNYCALRGMVSHHHLTVSEMRTAMNFIMNENTICDAPSAHLYTLQKKATSKKKCIQ